MDCGKKNNNPAKELKTAQGNQWVFRWSDTQVKQFNNVHLTTLFGVQSHHAKHLNDNILL